MTAVLDSTAEEYKGAMRLPRTDHKRITALANLTHRSLNDLVVEAVEFLCAVAEGEARETPLPDAAVTARALRAHRANPQTVVLIHQAAAETPRKRSGTMRKSA